MEEGKRVKIQNIDNFVDGDEVEEIGKENLKIIKGLDKKNVIKVKEKKI